MSALGQKRTYAAQQVMSALPPIATAKVETAIAHEWECCLCRHSQASDLIECQKHHARDSISRGHDAI
jgi:hypothetical protein